MVRVTERVQIGPTIPKPLWEKFRQRVKDRHGKVRGSLGDELENAIRMYVEHGSDKSVAGQLAEMNQRLQRLEGANGTAEADGGVDTSGPTPHAHAPSRLEVDEKPPANGPTDEKVAYLRQQVTDQTSVVADEPGMIPRRKLREVVKDEYGFRRDTAKRYVGELVDALGLVDHPDPEYDLLVTEPKREEIVAEREAERREAAAEDADEVLES